MYQGYKQILVELQDKILTIKFNNPAKKNCINRLGYTEIGRVFREVANDDNVTLVVLTGVGEFFTAGNDLSAAADITDIDAYIEESNAVFKEMVSSVIDCPKVVIALVNGPCIGVGVTLAGLCDLVWCSETAYFLTPFTKLGIVPEAGSSYLFPLLVGRSKATEMLLFNERLSAEEAYRYHFATKIFKMNEMASVIWPKIKEFSAFAPNSMQVSKKLLRMHEHKALIRALDAECDELKIRLSSEEFFQAMIQFSTRKTIQSKL